MGDPMFNLQAQKVYAEAANQASAKLDQEKFNKWIEEKVRKKYTGNEFAKVINSHDTKSKFCAEINFRRTIDKVEVVRSTNQDSDLKASEQLWHTVNAHPWFK